MYNNKLPLFKIGDILQHEEYDFQIKVTIVYEEDDGSFLYETKNLPWLAFGHSYTEEELSQKFVLIS